MLALSRDGPRVWLWSRLGIEAWRCLAATRIGVVKPRNDAEERFLNTE
jgi:hypothetical protein